MSQPPALPDTYRLLAVFNAIPISALQALELSDLRVAGERGHITDHHQALLRQLSSSGRIRWVTYGPDGRGYILTDEGANALDVYHARYGSAFPKRRGPALGQLAVKRLAAERARLLEVLEGRVGEQER